MTFLLREVLLSSLGIESDLDWIGDDSDKISAVSLDLLPPGAGALIKKIANLGKIYKILEELTNDQAIDPYKQAILDSIDSYLDSYRTSVLEADQEICAEMLTTLTGLVAHLDAYQHELKFIGKIAPKLLNSSPLEMLNTIHNYVVTSPPPIALKLATFESSLHQVAISQLDGYVFYHQALPDIFKKRDDGQIIYSDNSNASFIPPQLSTLLLLIVNVVNHCAGLFDKTDPPGYSQLAQWTAAVSHVTSALLSQHLQEQWPPFINALSNVFFGSRGDYMMAIARKMMQAHVTGYEIDFMFKKLGIGSNLTSKTTKLGLSLRVKIDPPLDLVVTDEAQELLSDIFMFLVEIQKAIESLKDLWILARKHKNSFLIIHLMLHYFITLQSFVIFDIITPSLTVLVIAGKDINDYLKFKAEFTTFIMRLAGLFPATDIEIQDHTSLLCKAIVDVWKILVVDNHGERLDDAELEHQFLEMFKAAKEHMEPIENALNKRDEQGIAFQNQITKITDTIGIILEQN